MRTTLARAGTLCLLAVTLTAGCVDSADPSSANDITHAAPLNGGADHSATLAALLARDWSELGERLGPHQSASSALRMVEQGPIQGYQGSDAPLIVRHAAAPDLIALVDAQRPLAAALLDTSGALWPVEFSLDPVPDNDGLSRLILPQSAIPAQGLLLIGDADSDLTALSSQTFIMAVVDDQLGCAVATPQCAVGDHACIISSHATCFEQDLSFNKGIAGQELDELDLLINYLDLYSDIKAVNISTQAVAYTKAGSWHALTMSAPAGVQLKRITEHSETGESRALTWRIVDGAYQLLAPSGGFMDGGLIVVDAASDAARLDLLGGARSPVGPSTFAQVCREWTVTGCLQVEDQETGATTNRPLGGIQVRPSSEVRNGFGIYRSWPSVSTAENGCFTTTRQICGLTATSSRRIRLDASLLGGNLAINNPVALESIFDLGFFRVSDQQGWRAPNTTQNVGNLVFRAGEQGARGVEVRRRQAVSWSILRRLNAALNTRDPWLRFQNFYKIDYPVPRWAWPADATALPLPIPILKLPEDDWDFGTLLHENGHIWHYMHNWGIMPNLITSLIDGWNTHNCQEDINIGFLEGFAEYFSQQARCDIFNQNCGVPRPLSRVGLLEHGTCNEEEEEGLTTPARVIRNDDGVTHALHLLTVNNFYQRNFQNIGTQFVELNPLPALPNQCQWYPMNGLDLFNVLRAFRAAPALGYNTNFSSLSPNGIGEFYDRFGAINNLPVGFIQDRLRFWDAARLNNPINICRQPCAETSAWWDGTQRPSTRVAERCDIMPVPAGQTAFVSDNRYYVNEQHNLCQIGVFDSENCYVLSPAAGTSPFIYGNGLYTTPLPGNVCPHGTFDGANCVIAWIPPGTQGFVYGGNLYTTPLSGCTFGVREGTNRCFVGQPPRGAAAQINAGAFSYPRQ